MRITPKYNFKIKELRDSPPDITVGEENWEKLELELIDMGKAIEVAGDRFDFEAWASMPGAIYSTVKESDGSYLTTLVINGTKKAERKEYPINSQGEYVTVETLFKVDGTVERVRTMREFKVLDVWKVEVV